MTDDDVQAVLAAEDLRYRAMVESDLTTMDRLCADELSYAHSSGARDTKAEYFEKVRSGYYDYLRIDHPVERVEVLGDTAIVVGRMTADLPSPAHPRRSTTWRWPSGPGRPGTGGCWPTRRRRCPPDRRQGRRNALMARRSSIAR